MASFKSALAGSSGLQEFSFLVEDVRLFKQCPSFWGYVRLAEYRLGYGTSRRTSKNEKADGYAEESEV